MENSFFPFPINEEDERMLFDDEMNTVSQTECTGLMPTPALDADEVSAYADIYNVPLSAKKKQNEKAGERD